MSVRRSQSFLNQQRVDVPHLRSIESAVRNDFDEFINAFAIGEDAFQVIRGFEIFMTGAIGSVASSLQMIVADSSLFHGASNEAGTFFEVPSGTANEILNSTSNTRIEGVFTPSALNYIGLEFTRELDDSTAAQVFFWNPTNKTEISKNVPLAETLDYKIVITNTLWASNVVPISLITTDSSNNVIDVEDRRPLLFRLGTAGINSPNPFNSYPWTNHAEGRLENPSKSTTSTSPFRGGDKQLLYLKEWADAVMSMLLEIKGTTYWYSTTTASGSLVKLRGDLGRLYTTGSGKYTHDASASGQINWDSDIFLNFIGSRLSYKISSNAATTDVTLGDNQVAYLNLVRGQSIAPNLIFTNGSAVVSSVGAASWTSAILVGDFIKLASEDDSQYFEILSVDSASQVTLKSVFDETSTGLTGAQTQFAFGTYLTDAAPSTNRHVQIDDRKDVSFQEDVYWLFFRNDNGGGTPKIFIRGSGELEKGEDRSISDNQTLDSLTYMGSAGEVDTTPDYDAITQPTGSLAGQSFNTVNEENLTVRIAKLNAMLADHKQDFNIELDPGVITWDGTNITITSARLSIPGTTIGAAPVAINNLGSTALAANSALYVDINRTTAGALTLTSATLASLTPSQQRLVVARNISGNILVR